VAERSTFEDEAAIAAVLVRYATGIDRRDWELFRTCFAERCDLVYEGAGTWTSAEEITAFMAESHAGMGHTLHRLSNIDVEVDGATAVARTYVDALLLAPDGRSGINPVGFYDDELALDDGQWRIVRRRFTQVRMRFWVDD
jgi:uncharacterized protein (TIGR02246 family)